MKKCKICKKSPLDMQRHIPTTIYICDKCMVDEYGIKHTYQSDYFVCFWNKQKEKNETN